MDPTIRTTRTLALVAVVVTVLAALYAAAGAITAWEPSWGFVAQAVIHLGELAAVIALALSGGAGGGWLARIGHSGRSPAGNCAGYCWASLCSPRSRCPHLGTAPRRRSADARPLPPETHSLMTDTG